MVNETEEADKILECVRCHQEIADIESYIVSQCNAADCGPQYSHQNCIQDYLTTNKHTSQSAALLKQQNKAIHSPHASLKTLVCPREECTGRVQDADRVIQTKKKKALKEALTTLHAAVPEPAVKENGAKPRKGPKQAQATKKHAAGSAVEHQAPKPKPFTQFQGKGEARNPAKASSLANVPQRVKPERNLSNRFGVLTTVNEDDDEEEETPEQQASKAEQSPSREEVDAAIKLGLLPVNFRTDWCKDFFKGKCSRGRFCSRAHSLEQLQFDAAIEAGKLDKRFKMQFCGDANNGECSLGIRCPNANSAKELRIHALFAESELDTSYHASRCPEWTQDGRCSEGLACFYAHGRQELRAEAAALLGNIDANYNFQLCENWYRRGECRLGDVCNFAHGLHEVRVCAAVHYSELNPGYKTVRCQRPRCEFPWKCHYYHSDRDQRRPVVRKTVYCPVWKELGHCEIVNCHWAHGVDDLDTNAFSYDFPQAQGGTEGVWAEVARQKLHKLRTGPSSLSEGNRPAVRTDLHSNGAEPLAVFQGKMPAQADVGLKPARKRNKHKSDFFQLCPRFEERGICNLPGCELAHGAAELEQRKLDTEAKRRGALPPVNPETAHLSKNAIQHLKNLKIKKCSEDLVEMGFTQGAYEMARKCGGDQYIAAQHYAEGKPPPAQMLLCDVQAEAASVLTMASDVGWTLGRLEEGIANCKGNVDSIFSAHMGETYDAPSTPGSDATTPAPKYQQSLSELKTKGIAVDDNGFPTYDPTLFGSDVHSDRQRSDMLAVSSSTDNSEMQKMLEAQAGMFDADGNLLPDAQDRLKADERREREQNLARREASMYESFGKSSSSNATRTAGSRHTGQITGLDHQLQSGTQTAVSKGLAQSHRQPPGFTPDRPAPAAIPSVSASINGFSQDATSQQNGFAHPHSQQQTQAPPQNPLTQFAADLNANGLDHSHRQPGAPAQRPQPTPLAKGNAFAHPQQPALQSYGSAGFSDTAMSSFSQPSASGDFSSELWAADARKHSQDWAWVQQQEQRKSAQRSAAQQPAAQQSFSQQGTAQQGFPQHQPGYRQQGSPQQQFHQQAAAPQPSLPHEHPFMQTSAAPVYSANATEPVPTHGFDPAEAMAKKVHVTDQEQDMDVNDLEDFILSSLNHD